MKRFVIVIIALLSMIISCAVPYTVTANVLNLRTVPSTSAPVGKTAVKGENINVVSVEGDWATVEVAGKSTNAIDFVINI
ncbi:MAG: SH3 domain-containing protein [Muribaculaceae bacterium]|nr:SH3 domain-containing protein [Muribaculaceae bacterium]